MVKFLALVAAFAIGWLLAKNTPSTALPHPSLLAVKYDAPTHLAQPAAVSNSISTTIQNPKKRENENSFPELDKIPLQKLQQYIEKRSGEILRQVMTLKFPEGSFFPLEHEVKTRKAFSEIDFSQGLIGKTSIQAENHRYDLTLILRWYAGGWEGGLSADGSALSPDEKSSPICYLLSIFLESNETIDQSGESNCFGSLMKNNNEYYSFLLLKANSETFKTLYALTTQLPKSIQDTGSLEYILTSSPQAWVAAPSFNWEYASNKNLQKTLEEFSVRSKN